MSQVSFPDGLAPKTGDSNVWTLYKIALILWNSLGGGGGSISSLSSLIAANPEAESNVALNGVTANTTGSSIEVGRNRTAHTVLVNAASVTTGATVNIQVSDDDATWFPFDSTTISANGQSTIFGTVNTRYIRATVTSYVDGTYTVTIISK